MRLRKPVCGGPHGEPAKVELVAPPTPKDERLKLLEFSYAEILDATKHQDDKINRLLTTVAFLTAASLALASLNSAGPLNADFALDPSVVLPLAKIALGAFLLGVVATVIMLITSLTTPLRFPGQGFEPFDYASKGAQVSQFYFHEISKSTRSDWEEKWKQDVEVLTDEKRRLLVRETHNLALRTEYKYARTNEAVAAFSCSLLFFALAAVLVLLASPPGNAAISFSPAQRWLLASVIFGYCWLMLMASVRAVTQSVSELGAVRVAGRTIVPGLTRYLFPLSASAVPGLLVAIPTPGLLTGLVVFVGPAIVATAALLVFCAKPRGRDSDDRIRKSLRVWGLVVTVLYAIAGMLAAVFNLYALQFFSAYSSALVLLMATVARSASDQRRKVKEALG